MRVSILAALAAIALTAGGAQAQNVLDNPGFESPTVDAGSAVDNWFRIGSGANGTSVESTTAPRNGSRHLELNIVGANQFAGAFQTLSEPVGPGNTVNFTGFHKSVLAPFNATVELKLEWAGAAQNRFDVLTLGSAYEQFSHTGVAPAGTTGLTITYAISSFGAGQGNATVHIDDFSATVIPEPATIGMLSLGALGLVAVRRRIAK